MQTHESIRGKSVRACRILPRARRRLVSLSCKLSRENLAHAINRPVHLADFGLLLHTLPCQTALERQRNEFERAERVWIDCDRRLQRFEVRTIHGLDISEARGPQPPRERR